VDETENFYNIDKQILREMRIMFRFLYRDVSVCSIFIIMAFYINLGPISPVRIPYGALFAISACTMILANRLWQDESSSNTSLYYSGFPRRLDIILLSKSLFGFMALIIFLGIFSIGCFLNLGGRGLVAETIFPYNLIFILFPIFYLQGFFTCYFGDIGRYIPTGILFFITWIQFFTGPIFLTNKISIPIIFGIQIFTFLILLLHWKKINQKITGRSFL
jgi:hypothetical protein